MTEGYSFIIGKGENRVELLSRMSNRHGLIAGATGTGKTITLKVMAEHFSSIGVPVFLADVKGDLASLAEPGLENPKLKERIDFIGIDNFIYQPYPVRIWDVFGELGHPVRTTISEMGPLLLSRLLGLNDTQEGVLSIVFRLADDLGMLLIDLKDLRSMLVYVGENAKSFTLEYGNVSAQSIGAIQRSLLRLEDQGGDIFFGEPALDIRDFMTTDHTGKGMINVLAAEKLFNSPTLYSSFLLWMLSELFEELPEVGDLPQPKIVFFFDEAHLLFDDAPKILMEKIEQVVRLIRSKGVGVFFITQNPIDIPDKILGQLGNRVQHALRAYTPRDERAVKSAAETFRQNPAFKVEEVITELKTGEALVSFLDTEGRPSIVERALISPPKSLIGTISPEKRDSLIALSPMGPKYGQTVDRESAYELLQRKIETRMQEEKSIEEQKRLEQEEKEQEKIRLAEEKDAEKLSKEEEKKRIAEEKAAEKLRKEEDKKRIAEEKEKEKERQNNPLSKVAKTTMSTITGDIGRKIARGLLGGISKKLFK